MISLQILHIKLIYKGCLLPLLYSPQWAVQPVQPIADNFAERCKIPRLKCNLTSAKRGKGAQKIPLLKSNLLFYPSVADFFSCADGD